MDSQLTYEEKGAYLEAIGQEMRRNKVCCDAAIADDTKEKIVARIVELLDCSNERAEFIWKHDMTQIIDLNWEDYNREP